MRRVIVQYKVKADKAAENERFAKAVFAQLERESTAGVHYATFKLEDGVSFVHFATIDDSGGTNPLTALSAFQAFLEQIKERCEVLPFSTTWTEVGNYRLLSPGANSSAVPVAASSGSKAASATI